MTAVGPLRRRSISSTTALTDGVPRLRLRSAVQSPWPLLQKARHPHRTQCSRHCINSGTSQLGKCCLATIDRQTWTLSLLASRNARSRRNSPGDRRFKRHLREASSLGFGEGRAADRDAATPGWPGTHGPTGARSPGSRCRRRVGC
jgi:hypothetical protein